MQYIPCFADIQDAGVAGVRDPQCPVAGIAKDALRTIERQSLAEDAYNLALGIQLDDAIVAGIGDVKMAVLAAEIDIARGRKFVRFSCELVDDPVKNVWIRDRQLASRMIDGIAAVLLDRFLAARQSGAGQQQQTDQQEQTM